MTKKKGAKGDSNPRPLAPKARIIPLDHEPDTMSPEGFEPPTFGSGIRRANHCAMGSRTYMKTESIG